MLSLQRLVIESMMHTADDCGWSALVGATTSALLALWRGHLGPEVGSSDRDSSDIRSRRAASENSRSSGPSWAAVAEDGADLPTASHRLSGLLSRDGRLWREGAWMPADAVVLGLSLGLAGLQGRCWGWRAVAGDGLPTILEWGYAEEEVGVIPAKIAPIIVC